MTFAAAPPPGTSRIDLVEKDASHARNFGPRPGRSYMLPPILTTTSTPWDRHSCLPTCSGNWQTGMAIPPDEGNSGMSFFSSEDGHGVGARRGGNGGGKTLTQVHTRIRWHALACQDAASQKFPGAAENK